MDIRLKSLYGNNGNIDGTYKDIDNNTVNELKKLSSDNKTLGKDQVTLLEKVAKKDGVFRAGEQLLISKLKSQTNNNTIKNLNIFEEKNISSNNILKVESTNQKKLENIKIFSKEFINTDKKTQDELIKFVQSYASTKNNLEIDTLLSALSPKTKETIKKLDINSQDRNIKLMPEFLKNISKLTKDDQNNTINILNTLNQNPTAINDKESIKILFDKIGKSRSTEIGKTLNSLNVFIPALNNEATTSEDASSRIKTMFMANYGVNENPPQSDYVRDVLITAEKENFSVDLQISKEKPKEEVIKQIKNDLKKVENLDDKSIDKIINNHLKISVTEKESYEWSEDNKFITNSGKILTLPKIENDCLTTDKMLAFATGYSPNKDSKDFAKEGIHTIGLPENDEMSIIDEMSVQGAVSDKNGHIDSKQLAKELNKDIKTTRTYNEGGNFLSGTLPNGESYAVIGRDGLLTSVFHLERENKLKKDSVPEFKNVNVKVQEMEKKGYFTKELINETVIKLQAANEIPQGQNSVKRAKEFLAKMEITEKEIFPKDMGTKNITFIPQPEFHIDMFMRPLRPGTMLVNDFDTTIDFLKRALSKTTNNSWEQNEIKAMLEVSEINKKIMSPIMDEVNKKLTESGIKVIKAPGLMSGQTKEFNFLNSTAGTSLGSNKLYYMTNYTTIKPLRDEFENFIKSQGIDTVYWIGNSGGSKETLSGSEKSLSKLGGMDCREVHENY